MQREGSGEPAGAVMIANPERLSKNPSVFQVILAAMFVYKRVVSAPRAADGGVLSSARSYACRRKLVIFQRFRRAATILAHDGTEPAVLSAGQQEAPASRRCPHR